MKRSKNVLVYAGPEPRRERTLEQALALAMRNKAQVHLVKGDPVETISAFAIEHEADLVVMGTGCRKGVAGFLMGDTADRAVFGGKAGRIRLARTRSGL
jgi:nucleotide-binding universal stress UspA family protein